VARHEDFAGLAKNIAMQIANPDFSGFTRRHFRISKEEVRQFESGKKIYKINPKRSK
jgi:hypothetical protein